MRQRATKRQQKQRTKNQQKKRLQNDYKKQQKCYKKGNKNRSVISGDLNNIYHAKYWDDVIKLCVCS